MAKERRPQLIDRLGESGKLVCIYAAQAAVDLAREAIGSEHLLLGVEQLGDRELERQFIAVGVDLAEVCRAVRADAPRGSSPEPDEVTFTPQGQAALERAAAEATQLGHGLVEAPHILIGVLGDRDGLPARKLTEAGARPDTLQAGLGRMLRERRWSAEFYEGRKAVEQPELSSTSKVLETLGRDLTAAARAGELNPLVGRDQETLELIHVLCGRRKNNAVLVGEPGIGKTAIVEGLAQRIATGNIPKQLAGVTIRTIEVGALVAGTIYRGQFEERLQDLVREVSGRTDVVLFIDEIHTLIGAGATGDRSLDAANILKPALAGRKLRVVGATTTDEFRRYFERDKALMRRFQEVRVDEPTPEEVREILGRLRSRYSAFHGVAISDGALDAAVEVSRRYMHDRRLPDKAFDLLDRACTQRKLGPGIGEWMPALAQVGGPRPDIGATVTEADIAEVASVLLEVPIAEMTGGERERLLRMAQKLKERVIGQDHAIEVVANSILGARATDVPADRPYGVFLFLGPSGVGKTKLAEEVASYMFGGRRELIRLDMSEFSEPHSGSALIGSPPGYAGWERGGRLTNAVRARPYSVVLLDEIEKAHPEVLKLFLPVFDEGFLTDQSGRVTDFRNTVIVMTSNVGAGRIRTGPPIGFTTGDEDEPSYDEVKREVDRELERSFSREFLNRIDEEIVFQPLSREALREIIGLLLEEMIPLELELSDEALDFLVEQSYVPTMGARPARRAIQRLIRNPLSLMLARQELTRDDTVEVFLREGQLAFAAAGERSIKAGGRR